MREEEFNPLMESIGSFEEHNKRDLLRTAPIIGAVVALSSIAQCIISILLLRTLITPLSITLLCTGMVYLISGLATLLWWYRTKHSFSDPPKLLTELIFYASILLLLCTILVLAAIYGHMGWLGDYFTALNSEPNLWRTKFKQRSLDSMRDFEKFSLFVLTGINSILILMYLALFLATYAHLKFKTRTLIRLVDLLCTLLLLFGLILVFFTKHIGSYQYNEAYPKLNSYFSIRILKVSGWLLVVKSFIGYFINWKRWRSGYFTLSVIGYILLCLTITSVGYSYRQAESMRNYTKNSSNCPTMLSQLGQEEIRSYGCPNKYLESQGTKCPYYQLADMWELDEDKPNSEKLQTEACLNMQCCPLIANYYAKNFYIVSDIALASVLLAAVITVTMIVLCRESIDDLISVKSGLKLKYFCWTAAASILVMHACFSAVNLDSGSSRVKSRNADFPLTQLSDYPVVSGKDFGYQACFEVTGLSLEFHHIECSKGNCSDYRLMLLLLAVDSRWKYDPNYYNKGIALLDPSYKYTFFPTSDENDGFLGIEGSPETISHIMKEKFQVCPSYPGHAVELRSKTYQYKRGDTSNIEKAAETRTETIHLHYESNLMQTITGQIVYLNREGTSTSLSQAVVSLKGLDEVQLEGMKDIETETDGFFTIKLRKFKKSVPYRVGIVVSKTGYRQYYTVVQIGGFPFQARKSIGQIRLRSQEPDDLAMLSLFPIDAFSEIQLSDVQLELWDYDGNFTKTLRHHQQTSNNDKQSTVIQSIEPSIYLLVAYSEYYCRQEFLVDVDSKYNEVKIPMVKNNTHLQSDLILSLGSVNGKETDIQVVFETSSSQLCRVSSTSPQCAGVSLFHCPKSFASLLLSSIGKAYYLIFLRLRESKSNTQSSMSPSLQINGASQDFGSSLPFPMPSKMRLDHTDEPTDWLAFCIDGSEGLRSIVFFDSQDEAASSTYRNNPSKVCKELYHRLQ